MTEAKSQHRSCFQRDRDRIIHSTAFRRLKHKTQVFVEHEGDHFRSRLTHSIEVAQVARTISRALGLNEELTEAVALAHDLGHTPFGHAGEDVLDACMAPYGGFDHNAQAIRIVTHLEQHYAAFDGLNLTWETLEGLAKHNGPVVGALPMTLAEYNETHDLELTTHASAEAQVAALADDIAYNNHDLDDGLRSGLLHLDEVSSMPVVCDCFADVDKRWPNLDPRKRRHEALRRVFGIMVEDVLRESRARLAQSGAGSASDIRELGTAVIAFSDAFLRDLNEIRSFLYANLYRHPQVMAVRQEMAQVMQDLFHAFLADPGLLPAYWPKPQTDLARYRLVADYIAGMTDRYALHKHDALAL